MTPAGVVPRHLQQWLLLGIAAVMVGIMALSGGPTKPHASATASPAAAAVDANQQRIEEYARRIQEQTQRLAAEQAQLDLTKEAVATGTAGGPTALARGATGRGTVPSASPDRAGREDHARFADNVAFVRPTATPMSEARAETASVQVAPRPVTAVPTSATPPSVRTDPPPPTPATDEPRYRVFEGTVIETVLTNRLTGTFTGPVNCLVNVPVYASDQQHLVIPAGSRVLGEARAVDTFGQSRLAVVFHRVLLPDGTRIDLNGFHGLNQVGDVGLQDEVNHHYAQIFGVSLAIGAIAGLAQAQSTVGLDATALDAYRQGAAANVAQSSVRILDRFLNILPTVTIREGHRIKVYLANDLELPAYRETAPLAGDRR
jgi:type IV secretion system protein VirB10